MSCSAGRFYTETFSIKGNFLKLGLVASAYEYACTSLGPVIFQEVFLHAPIPQASYAIKERLCHLFI